MTKNNEPRSTDDNDGVIVEIAFIGTPPMILLRNPDDPILMFTPDEWQAFISAVRNGEFEP